MIEGEQACSHPNIVPVDKDWARCTACGDSSFPLSDFAAGMPCDPDAPVKKRRKSSTSPTQRTLAECRKRGWIAQVVEQHIPFPKPFGTKRDLFGVIDIVAIVTTDTMVAVGCSLIGIQATSALTGGNHAARRHKILAEPRARQWLEAGGRLELWSWSKRGDRGKAKRWTLRVEAFSVEDWSQP